MSSLMIAGGYGHFSVVRFDFGQPPEEALRILQAEDRWIDLDFDRIDDEHGMLVVDEFVDKHLGNRAMVWAESEKFLSGVRDTWMAFKHEPKWNPNQEAGVRTLLWAALHSPAKMLLPETNQLGMVRGFCLHDAIRHVMTAQAAFWALTHQGQGR